MTKKKLGTQKGEIAYKRKNTRNEVKMCVFFFFNYVLAGALEEKKAMARKSRCGYDHIAVID